MCSFINLLNVSCLFFMGMQFQNDGLDFIDFKIPLKINSFVILFFHNKGESSSHQWHIKVGHRKESTQRMLCGLFLVCCRIAKEEEKGKKETKRRKKDNELLKTGKSLAPQISEKSGLYSVVYNSSIILFILIHINFLGLQNLHFYLFCHRNPCLSLTSTLSPNITDVNFYLLDTFLKFKNHS